jgi:hypothetical protein
MKLLTAFLCIVHVLFCSGSFAEGSEWVYYFTSPVSGDFFYDKSSIDYHSKDTFQITEKHTLNQNAIENGEMYLGEEYRKVDHCLILTELNCNMRSYRTLKHSGYSRDGEMVHDITIGAHTGWHSIPDKTALDVLHRQLCTSTDP